VYSADVLLAVAAGAFAGGGILLLVASLRGMPVRRGPDRARRREEMIRTLTTRTAVAVLAGAAVLVVTRWPMAAIGTGALVLAWNGLAGGAAEERRGMARLEGLAAWAESLRDTIAGAVGLEQAIPASLRGGRRRPRSSARCATSSTACTPACRCPRRCAGSPTTWTTRPPTSSSPP
jgi:hypothetical protein